MLEVHCKSCIRKLFSQFILHSLVFVSPSAISIFKLSLQIISLVLILILKLISHLLVFILELTFHGVVFVCQIKSKTFSLWNQSSSLSIFLRGQSTSIFLRLILSWLISLKVISLQLFLFIFMCKVILVILLLLSLNGWIQITNGGILTVLELSMGSVVLVNFLNNCFDMRVKFHSFVFRLIVFNGCIFSMLGMIINNRALSIQSNNCCLQPFDFNFLFWNCHLRRLKFSFICVTSFDNLLGNESGWCSLFFRTGHSCRFSWGTHNLY